VPVLVPTWFVTPSPQLEREDPSWSTGELPTFTYACVPPPPGFKSSARQVLDCVVTHMLVADEAPQLTARTS
jgi:hypothetical protein